jgi:acyl carrier protein phosphodiesterase
VNYLAHALLAQPGAAALIGNLAGDHVKGRLDKADLHPDVRSGVQRHRAVDALSDAHPDSRRARAVFQGSQRRVAGIFLDVWYDHLLTRHWRRYSALELETFERHVYATLTTRRELLPSNFAELAPGWSRARWLRAYRTVDGVAAVLERLARRRPAFSVLPQLLAPALARDETIEQHFIGLLDDLLTAQGDQLAGHVLVPCRDTSA